LWLRIYSHRSGEQRTSEYQRAREGFVEFEIKLLSPLFSRTKRKNLGMNFLDVNCENTIVIVARQFIKDACVKIRDY
jgi:hypothetical protein